jgi:ribosomal protein L11
MQINKNTQNHYYTYIDSKNAKLAEISTINKTKKLVKYLSFMILSQDAKLKSVWGPTLTPLIGKDKITEFCNSFNKDSALLYENDIFIPTFFLLFENKTFSYILRTPTLFTILKYLYDLDKVYRLKYHKKVLYYITLEELFYIIFIKYSDIIYSDLNMCVKEIVHNLHNFNIKIIK